MFHHPLCIAIAPMAFPRPLEEIIDLRQQMLDQQMLERKFESAIFRYERPYRMTALLHLTDCFDGRKGAIRFWRLAANVWTDAEYSESDYIWTKLMWADIPHRWAMTASADRRYLRTLPEIVTIYKGVQAPTLEEAEEIVPDGWSWTFDIAIARKFANRYRPPTCTSYIATAKVSKQVIMAYLTHRGEREVLIEPGTVWDARVKKFDRETIKVLDS
jgi:hypothetical protein